MRLPTLNTRGFSLLEMIITVSIVLIVFGGGLAAFIRFNDRQRVQATASEIRQFIKSAQTRARVRDNPNQAGCTLQGYRVTTTGALATMSLLCGSSKFSTNVGVERARYTVPSGITVSSMSINFYTLAGSAEVLTPIDNEIRVNGGNVFYMFRVEESGEIEEGCFVSGATSDDCV